MNILVYANRKYLRPLLVCLSSLKRTNRKRPITIVFAQYDFDSDALSVADAVQRFCRKKGFGFLKLVIPWDNRVASIPLCGWDPTVLLRLFAPFFLPADMKRILFLDSDVVVLSDLFEFYTNALGEQMIAGVLDSNDQSEYINSGFALVDVAKYCALFGSLDLFVAAACKVTNIQYPDQDILNALFRGKKKCFYNEMYYPTRSTLNRKKALVVHYVGKHKPWDRCCCTTSFRDNWFFWRSAIEVYGVRAFASHYCRLIYRRIHM